MIGKKLKYLIKSTKRKQIDLAKHLGISPSRLSNYLSDKREPDFEMLAEMALYLGVDMNYFAEQDFSGKRDKKIGGAVAVAESEAPYGSEKKNFVINVAIAPINAKKRGVNHTTLPLSGIFFEGIENPQRNAMVFEVNGYVPTSIAEADDYLVCVRCSQCNLSDGDYLFENGRNAKFFKYHRDNDIILLINEDNNKEHLRIEDPEDLGLYFKILWVIKKI